MTKRSEVLAGTLGAEVLAGTLGDAERGRMVIAMPGRRYFHQRDLARSGQAAIWLGMVGTGPPTGSTLSRGIPSGSAPSSAP
jgi:hypothetical protein